jgi:hypothetical protein
MTRASISTDATVPSDEYAHEITSSRPMLLSCSVDKLAEGLKPAALILAVASFDTHF